MVGCGVNNMEGSYLQIYKGDDLYSYYGHLRFGCVSENMEMEYAHEKSAMDNREIVNNKTSDFSIDYILNSAGSSSNSKTNVMRSEQYHNISENDVIPMFDWLQYTRYRPPKLPRPTKPGPIKRTPGRLPRVPFTPAQLSALENAYKQSTYLSSEEANRLASELDLTNTRVKIWFQNRRARERREKREREGIAVDPMSSPEDKIYLPYYKIF